MGVDGDVETLLLDTNDYPGSSLLFLLPDDNPRWDIPLRESLVEAGYQLEVAAHVGELIKFVAGKSFDAVIAADDGACFSVLSAMTAVDAPSEPLRVLLSDTPWEIDPESQADLVSFPHAPSLIFHLRAAFKRRAETAALQRETARLQRENERLAAAIEQQNRLNEQARTVSDEITLLKAAIVQNVSHELRTPLIQVKAAVALLAEEAQNSKLSEYAMMATGRLEAVVLNITQLGSSNEVTFNPAIVRDLIDQANRRLGRSWRYQDQVQRVKTILPKDLPPVLGDPQMLVTVLYHLIENALEYSADRPVEVSANIVDNLVWLSVRDEGIGIAPEHVGKIFNSFFQVDGSSTRRHNGMGVGLALVRLYLHRHGSRIEVESTLGKGSTFSFPLQIANLKSDNYL